MASQDNMLLLYGMLQNAPGKTMQQKLNFLQDIGFDPFGSKATPFQETPAPVVYNPMDVYGGDEQLRSAFDLIQNQNVDPFTAAQQVGIQSQADLAGNVDPKFKILTSWAETNMANKARMQQWQNEQDAAQSAWAAKQPTSMQDIVGQTAYDALSQAAGQPLDAKGLVDAYARNKVAGGRQMAAPVRGSLPNAFGSDAGVSKLIRSRMEGVAGRRLDAAKQRYMPSEKGQQLLDLLSIYGKIGG